MANNNRAQAAADQLYAADPAEFTDRRSDLVAQARADGDQAAARAIGALRRPTRAAWVVNQLARADPDAVARLGRLGDELRAAESALDGGKLRELSQTRRKLLGQLARQALDGAGVTDPPDALLQEVTGTLSAALADPQVAARVGQGRWPSRCSRPASASAWRLATMTATTTPSRARSRRRPGSGGTQTASRTETS